MASDQRRAKSPQIEISIGVQVDDVLAVGQNVGQCQYFGNESIDPDWSIAAKSDYFLRLSSGQRTQTECSSM